MIGRFTEGGQRSEPFNVHERVLAVLAEALAETGDSRYSVALGIVRGSAPGRPTRDDTGSLAVMREMLDFGLARSVEHAAKLTAAALIGEMSQHAAAARLARKFRTVCSTYLVKCEAPVREAA